MAKTVNIHEAKTHLSALLKEVLEGEQIIIAKNNTPIAELKKYEEKPKKRVAGTLRDEIKIYGDFSDADAEIEQMFNESKLFPDENNTD